MDKDRGAPEASEPASQAEQLRDLGLGMLHDHMHWENGVLVEDTPTEAA